MVGKQHVIIDRQYGSGGREVGRILSEKQNIPFYDKELLIIAAEQYGLNPGILKERDEKRNGSLLYNIALFADSMQNYGKMTEPYEIFEAECGTIKRLAQNGSCVFIGRCADYVLDSVYKPIHVFIYASSMEERIRRATGVDHVDKRNIETYIKRKDQQRKGYYNFFTEKEWGVMENYDLCLNSSKLGYEGCADVIISLMNQSSDKSSV